jgi:DNA-binding NarL/FixJ family response regulator
VSNEHRVSILEQPEAPFVTTARVDAPAALSLVVVDPQAAVREGLPLLLRSEGIDVLAAAATGEGGAALIDRHDPDVALIALDLADVDGLLLLRSLLQRGTRSAVVLYADDERGDEAAVALHAGAAGVIA